MWGSTAVVSAPTQQAERDMLLYPLGYHVLEYKESESVVSSSL